MKRFNLFFTPLFIIAVVAMTGCKEAATIEPPAPVISTYIGTIASGTESGLISLRFASGGGAVSGEIIRVRPSAATIILSGTFANSALSASGGNYSFVGLLADGNVSGAYTGPNGPGLFTTQPSVNNSVRVFAGTYTTTVVGQLNGTFNLVINAAVITGWTISTDNQHQTGIAGTLQDSTITLNNITGTALGTGTIHGSSSVSGTYNTGTDQGSWAGQRVQ